MFHPIDPRLRRIREAMSQEAWHARVEAARERAGKYARVQELEEGGLPSASAALREVFPDDHPETRRAMYRRYREQGVEGLIDRRWIEPVRKLTAEVEAFIRALLTLKPGMRAHEVHAAVQTRFEIDIGESTVRRFLTREGLSAPVGRPRKGPEVTALPLAGAELLKAVDHELGATRRLTRDVERALSQLPAPEGDVRDDREHRDERGRFLPEYNAPEPRRWPELGAQFESVELKRKEKDLQAMRVAKEEFPTLHRKVQAMTHLPLLAPSGRWDGLSNWRGAQLDELCGYAYQPASLDKFVREMKYAGMGEVCRDSVARFWFTVEGPVKHPAVGAVVLYVDKATNPVWTHHWTECVSVARLGKRVMPGTSTSSLHSGYGTPLLYHTVSGNMALGEELTDLLARYEETAGQGTARRLVIIDREAHSAGVFKELDAKGWLYVVPLRQSVVGPNARFEDIGDWEEYRETDAVRSASLWLNDSRKGESALEVRALARRRGRTGSVAWYATNAPAGEFETAGLIDAYFDRWPLQEHVYRDANASVNLDAHHGYGKLKVVNLAVLDAVEKLDASIAKGVAALAEQEREIGQIQEERARYRAALDKADERVAQVRAEVGRELADTNASPKRAGRRFDILQRLEDWRESIRTRVRSLGDRLEKLGESRAKAEHSLDRKQKERAKKAARTEIFTVDTELDEILTGFKLTFLNLCNHLQRHYLGTRMETDTLIQHVLTLPGERVVTRDTETIRIWRQPRERKFMDAVEEACRRLTAKRLVREKRTLRFEVVDQPAS